MLHLDPRSHPGHGKRPAFLRALPSVDPRPLTLSEGVFSLRWLTPPGTGKLLFSVAHHPIPMPTDRRHPWGTPPWKITLRPRRRPLPECADIVIIGAGFSGLSAAANLLLLDPQKSVVVLEAFTLGQGASGRTGGMALAETAAGPLPGLGNVLAGYQKILKKLNIHSELHLPGALELARGKAKRDSPILWNDSGWLGVTKKVPGGTVHPGKVVSGLARAAERGGAHIAEYTEATKIEFTTPLKIHVRQKLRGRTHQKTITAQKILLATNAGSLELTRLHRSTDPMLTFALMTAPLSAGQIKSLGLESRQPFYTVDFPYLWGRLNKNNCAIFGAGIVGVEGAGGNRAAQQVRAFVANVPPTAASFARQKSHSNDASPLAAVNVRKKGPARDRLQSLEHRVLHLHAALKSVRITHRWGGPILFTQKMLPIFGRHPKSRNVLILAGFNGHGVALSTYLGHWAAQSLLGVRNLPNWKK